MPRVYVHDDESIDRALKRFKKACEREGLRRETRRRRAYEKPSEARRRKARQRIRQLARVRRKLKEQGKL